MKTDDQLQKDVIEELVWELSLDHTHIGVAVASGVVTLTGFVGSYVEKMSAEKAVRRVAGVTALAEEIEVRLRSDPKTADDEIAKRIVDVLTWNVLVPVEKIEVKVERGWVTLTGTVDWAFQRDEAKKSAGRISGVIGVGNLIEVRRLPAAADIKDRIFAAFMRQADLDASAISVRAEDGVVYLGGHVHHWGERRIAERAAWSAPGVTAIEDKIRVSA